MTIPVTNVYAVYLEAACGTIPAGTVINRVVWAGDGQWEPPSGQSVVLDNEGEYPIGSVYVVKEAAK
ncbi:hypothetical protein [Gluconobacter cerinus]|uniref:hypothetical protein n=1 Tax=Gluconobacter cerinus TaxID=38307 RepID=UPI001B8C647F|nr:hypothetical protein [Gluconobacter cerinus]MBS1034981.1 hypothetical protein [Gluconobacter cerinus]